MQKNTIQVYLIPVLALGLVACSLGGLIPSQKTSVPAIQRSTTTEVLIKSTLTPEPPTQPAPEPTELPTLTVAPIQNITLVTREITENIPAPPVKISVEYPFMQEPAGDKAFNQEIKSLVQAQIDDMKKNAADAEDWRSKNLPDFFSQLFLKYAVALADKNFAAVRLEVSPYVAGAAHPNFFYLTVNYDLKTGRFLKLADLFRADSNYLVEIAAFCKTDLEQQALDPFFAEGLVPKEENFQNWNLTKDGLQILFDPYQVASWAQGPQKVLIPYNKLQKILLPSGPVEVLINGM